jgi:hypothetical protein
MSKESTMKLSPLALSAFLALGTLSALPAIASAQNLAPSASGPAMAGPPLAPAQTSGTVTRYIVGPMGHVRGLTLNNGAIVMLNGRLGDAVARQIPVGQPVSINGFANPSNPLEIFRASVSIPSGAVVATPAFQGYGQQGGANGHHRDPARRAEMTARLAQLPVRNASGTVQAVLAGPRGRAHGVLLSDGTSVFFGRGIARDVSQRGLHVGESLRVSGRGNTYPQGASLLADALTFADGTTVHANGPMH